MKGFYKHVFLICALISCLFFLTSPSQSYYGGPAPYPSYGRPYGPYGPTPYNQPYNPMGYQPQPSYGYGWNQPSYYGGYYPGYNYSQPPGYGYSQPSYYGNYPYRQPAYYQPGPYGTYQPGGYYPGYNYSQPPGYSGYPYSGYPYQQSSYYQPYYSYPYSGGYYQSATQQFYVDADEELDDGDDDDEITLEEGETLSIILPSNQSTGHWRLDDDELNDDIVDFVSSQYFPLPEGSVAVNLILGPTGAYGREQWIFEADEPGTTTIVLEYVPNYILPNSVIVQDTFEVEVTVVED